MKKKSKRILKFVIESTAVIIVIFSVFSAGRYIKSRKDSNNNEQQTVQQNQNNDNTNNNQNNQKQEKKNIDEAELNKALNSVVDKYKGNNEIGIVYKNFTTGYRFAVEDEHYFTAASTIKVIYAMRIYDRINSGEISKEDDVIYNAKFLEAGGGEITNQPKKNSYKLDYVIQNMIQYSDNTATNMLTGTKATAANIVTSYFSQLGVTLSAAEAQKNRITPKMMEVIWTKLYNERDKYPDLLKYLEDSKDYEWIKEGITGKKIASKYGGLNTNMHDTAIVFGNEDYMLLIYTNNLRNSGESITQMAKEINNIADGNI